MRRSYILWASVVALYSQTQAQADAERSLPTGWALWESAKHRARAEAFLRARSRNTPMTLVASNLSKSAMRLSSPTHLRWGAAPLEAPAAPAAAAAAGSSGVSSGQVPRSGTPARAVGEAGRATGAAGTAGSGPRSATPPVLSAPASIKVFIGIVTSPNPSGAQPFSKSDYAARRQQIRETWMREAAQYDHIAVKFVIGQPPGGGGRRGSAGTMAAGKGAGSQAEDEGGGSGAQWRQLWDEAGRFGDFLQLGIEDCYRCLTNKTREFFATVVAAYPAVEWIVKADDDVYVQPQRLLMAADQWAAAGADYVGCMDMGVTNPNPRHRWHEPNAAIIGPGYPLRALGSLYVLSARVTRDVIARRHRTLRGSGSCEDSAVGVWLLGSDAVYLDDRRLCSLGCSNASVAVYDTRDQGLGPGVALALHASPACQTRGVAAEWPLPYAVPQPQALPGKGRGPKAEAELKRQAVWAQLRV